MPSTASGKMLFRKRYTCGGSVGAIGDGERYGANYELPNNTAYNETCAAIANVYWNYRMFLLHGMQNTWMCWEDPLQWIDLGVGLDEEIILLPPMPWRSATAFRTRIWSRSVRVGSNAVAVRPISAASFRPYPAICMRRRGVTCL